MAINLPFQLVEGKKVISYRNGKVCQQEVSQIKESSTSSGIKVTIQNGESIIVSRDHKLWASLPEYSISGRDGYCSVYLMFREGFGFRVGVTNKGYSKNSKENLSSRLIQEAADKLWLLETYLSREEALLKEEIYSLQYGVPTAVFRGESRGLDQNYINKIFEIFGQNGLQILKDRQISFNLPHWQNCSASKGEIKRSVIRFVNHSPKGSKVTLEWSEANGYDHISKILKKEKVTFTKAKGDDRFRVRNFFYKNKDAVLFFNKLKSSLNLNSVISLSNTERKCFLQTAGSLHKGMMVPLVENQQLKFSEITQLEEISGVRLNNLSIRDSNNLIVNNIIVPTFGDL